MQTFKQPEQTLEQPNQLAKPWYKEFWFWFVMAIPIVAIISGTAMIIVSVNGADTLVRDNYYKDGLAIKNDLSRDYKAKDLKLAAKINVDNLTGDVNLKLAGKLEAFPGKLILSLVSPTIPNDDQTFVMHHISKGHYVGQLQQKVQGKRYIQLETIPTEKSKYTKDDWRLISDWYVSQERASIELGSTPIASN